MRLDLVLGSLGGAHLGPDRRLGHGGDVALVGRAERLHEGELLPSLQLLGASVCRLLHPVVELADEERGRVLRAQVEQSDALRAHLLREGWRRDAEDDGFAPQIDLPQGVGEYALQLVRFLDLCELD